ncbi:MAG: hypothetical protein JJE52_17320 [Acidimicrobiia bacterium]|nr:hypothetical protein [Acidimicrobiia bacterium]
MIAGSAIALLIFSFLPWFTFDLGPFGGNVSVNGWDVGFLWGVFPVILGIIMLVQVALTAFSPETKLPDLPVTWGQVHLGAGGLAALLVVLKLLIGQDGFSRGFGLFLAAVAAIGLAAGGFLKFQAEKSGTSAAPPSTF